MVKITRNASTSNLTDAALPWSYAQSPRLRTLLREKETARAAEVNQAAGLAWRVYQTKPFFFVGGEPNYDDDGVLSRTPPDGHFRLVGTRRTRSTGVEPDCYLNVRDDVHRVIGIVKKRYRILQNDEAPVVLDQLVAAGELRYEAAGALHDGSQVWWLATLPAALPRTGLQMHVLLTNSHDGSTSLTVSMIAVHPQTTTTLAWPLPTAARTMALRHTDSLRQRALGARRVLEHAAAYRVKLEQTVEAMAATLLTEPQFTAFLDALVPTRKPVTKDDRVVNQRGVTMAENTKDLIRLTYLHDDALAPVRGTLFAALLACQFYTDHLSISRTTEGASAEENRFKRLTSGTNLGCQAFSRALNHLR